MRHIKITRAADGIASIVMDNADESMNLVSEEFVTDFTAAVAELADDAGVRGIIVTSAKPAFMAGADLKRFVGRPSKHEALAVARAPSDMHRRLETCGKPVVAVINGLALGGGYELALACHHRILADDPGARVGLPEVTVGLLPGSGGTQRLARMIGLRPALAVLLDGKPRNPDQALKAGLVDQVVPRDRMDAAARAWIDANPAPVQPWDRDRYAHPEGNGLLVPSVASYLSTLPAQIARDTFHNYPAAAAIAACVFEGIQLPFDAAQKLEQKYFAKLLSDPVAGNIIRTTFVNKGEAKKLARRPAGLAKVRHDRVGVLGAGLMGAGIAQVAAEAGMDVVLLDRTQDEADKGRAKIEATLAREVQKGRRTEAALAQVMGRITATADVAALATADIIVEAVFEDTAVKADITRRVQAVVRPGTLFATNTSTLPITRLARAAQDAGRFIGLHFFSPVNRMELVEVIRGQATTDATLAEALDFVERLRKVPITVNDSRGFYTSRVFQTFIHEGMAMLGEGTAPALIENAARFAGFPVGPLTLLDEVTVDLPMKIIDQAIAEEGAAYQIPCGHAVAARMIALGRNGRKTGGGFYDYAADGSKQLWPGLADHFPVAADQPPLEELKKRFLYIQALETARCLEEGVLVSAVDGDLGAVLGWSYPTWTGGTLSLIDMVGLRAFIAECDRLAQRTGPRFTASDWLRARADAGQPLVGAA